MRFMMLMLLGGHAEAGPCAVPVAARVAEMMEYNAELQRAGVLLALDGLHPPAAAEGLPDMQGRRRP